jgi:hypothetical protein
VADIVSSLFSGNFSSGESYEMESSEDADIQSP